MIKRDLMSKLVIWKNKGRRKPLLLRGVRQCGKTWLLQEFGRLHFQNVAYFNLERNEPALAVFAADLDPKRILLELGALGNVSIEPQKTLIILDEIQQSPRALNSLKYFCEEMPEYAIVAAGSLLGVALSRPDGFPVGKVSFLDLFPCTFMEYLARVNEQLAKYCQELDKIEPISEALARELEKHFRNYLIIGGMPEAIETFIENNDMLAVGETQDDILLSYELDFAKHAPNTEIPKLFLLWKAIPLQLARENSKFVYGEVKSGARARDLEDALRWLLDAGLINKVSRIEQPHIPLAAYEDRRSFKLYMADTGLLCRKAKMSLSNILLNQDVFGEFKGRLIENYVQQQLMAQGHKSLFYWTSGNTAEVDFVISHENMVSPVEVKSGMNVRSRSLKTYREKYKPELAIRFSLQNLKQEDGLLNIPLYLIEQCQRFISIQLG